MSQPAFMQLYVADYLGDTQHLTTEQHGAYLLLLMTMWRQGGYLPNDPVKLARIARVHPPRWARVAKEVMPFFEAADDGQITHGRLLKELEKARHKSRSRATSGAAGGRAKALKSKQEAVANASDLSQHSSDIRYQKEESSSLRSEPKKASTIGTFLPAEWSPDAAGWALALRELGSEALTERELARFRDFWGGKSGAAGRKRDWPATWRNWCRKTADDNRKPQHGQRSNPADTALAGLARAARKLSGLDQPGGRGPPAAGDDDFGGPEAGFAGPSGTVAYFPQTRLRA